MSDKDKEPKKKGGLVKKLLIPVLLVAGLGGGGAAAGFFAAGAFGGSGPTEDPNAPKVVMKDGSKVSASAAGIKGAPSGAVMDSKFKVTYYPMEQPFTANLRGDTGFAQMSLAVSTYFDEKIVEALKEHDIAVRSAVLMTISENDAMSLESMEGKQRLKQQIKDVINKTLSEKAGFGGVDDVYFTSLVVQ
ncbi:flagellar basal body-associated protein FliL [Blastomonas sp.]|uniref:flagellar basal body-associated FliL family protein n=1 Tax=Blastomonas sp. TaxID=1909299 RepID=UPI003594946A